LVTDLRAGRNLELYLTGTVALVVSYQHQPKARACNQRVMALTGALCQTLLAATGFTNKSLRALIAGLLGSDYRPGR
jgi:hypothetical protein